MAIDVNGELSGNGLVLFAAGHGVGIICDSVVAEILGVWQGCTNIRVRQCHRTITRASLYARSHNNLVRLIDERGEQVDEVPVESVIKGALRAAPRVLARSCSHEIVLLHGSAVLLGDIACIILGRPLSGKTTMVKAMVDGGFGTLISDDVVLVRADEGMVEPCWCRPLLLRTVRDWRGEAPVFVERYVHADTLWPGKCVPRSARPGLVILLQYHNVDESQTVRLTEHELAVTLFENCFATDHPCWRGMRNIVQNVVAYRIIHNCDDMSCLAEWVRSIADSIT